MADCRIIARSPVTGILCLLAVFACFARSQAPSVNTVEPTRYHYGDDPRLADPGFDDSEWPVAEQGRWPVSPFDSNGFMWIRLRLPVPSDAAGPLALRVNAPGVPIAYEVFVNSRHVGSFGRVPPHDRVEALEGLSHGMVYEIPLGLTGPGATATIALRAWYPPRFRREGAFSTAALVDSNSFEIDQSRTLQAKQAGELPRVRLQNLPGMALNVLSILIGLAVLWLWRSTRSRDLLLCGSFLSLYPLFILFNEVLAAGPFYLSLRGFSAIAPALAPPGMVASVELVWGINSLKDVWFKRLAYGAIVVFALSVTGFFLSEPSAIVQLCQAGFFLGVRLFNILLFLANLWVFLVKRQNRIIAATMGLIALNSLFTSFLFIPQFAGLNLFVFTQFIATAGLSAALALRAWKEWRTRDLLRAEFDAAREVQQRLVTPAADVPGFQIESAYLPATHVGGDFFYIRPENPGGLLVVVGDVSGKGLRAALTVSAIMGALRTMPSLPPSRILGDLNRGLAGQLRGGFVTCCATRIESDGTLTLANAGHLAPYRNGEEMNVAAGLPLGVDAGIQYDECQLSLHQAEPLTFVSDGVVEARKPTGELFGFERAREMSESSAAAIAEAAQAFGQEDDITVVQLRRVCPSIATS